MINRPTIMFKTKIVHQDAIIHAIEYVFFLYIDLTFTQTLSFNFHVEMKLCIYMAYSGDKFFPFHITAKR